ncbi:MAG: hypothetical protein J1F63_01915 [Oscillospiraceae bacterium]|nr:hypothetical protein [Oscillospiraceae bacterium]
MLKKIISTMAMMALTLSAAVSSSAVTMYSPDGRTAEMEESQSRSRSIIGWYTEPPILMYAADGDILYVIPSEVEAYKSVGWYTEPPVLMYAADGRTLYVIPSEVEAYEAVGWHTDIPVKMYAADGRTLDVSPSEVDAYKAVGWYTEPITDPEKIYYNRMIALKQQYPTGTPWDNGNFYSWNGGIYSFGYGCAAFAFMLSDAAFGDLPSRIVYPVSFKDVRVGDILRINENNHSVIVLEVKSDHVVIAEGNYNYSVYWGRTLSASEVERADYLMTRYPE